MEQKYLEMISNYSTYLFVMYLVSALSIVVSYVAPKYVAKSEKMQYDMNLAITAFSIGIMVSLFISCVMI